MKQHVRIITVAMAFCLFSFYAFAQQNRSGKTPSWIPDRGYWVVENKIGNPHQHTIRFYDSGGQLIYTESVNGVRLNTSKRKTKMKLRKALDLSLLAWDKNKKPGENEDYFSALLK